MRICRGTTTKVLSFACIKALEAADVLCKHIMQKLMMKARKRKKNSFINTTKLLEKIK